MKLMNARLAATLTLAVAACGLLNAHCEIPCGIYGDKTRIDLLFEDIKTVEKSMSMINELSGKTDAQSTNQTVRWIQNKDEHASRIQHTVTQYFMTQRVKIKPAGDAGHERYLAQLGALHAMLVSAMKCKQTVDAAHANTLHKLVDQFAEAYFAKEDLEHIREHHGKKHD